MLFPTLPEVIILSVLISSTTVLVLYLAHVFSPKQRSEAEKLAYDLGTLFVRFIGLLLSGTLGYFLISDNLFAIGIAILVSYLVLLLVKARI